ncbi:MAG: hypothetical protein AAB373_01450 [Patescibacteria group bacterium]
MSAEAVGGKKDVVNGAGRLDAVEGMGVAAWIRAGDSARAQVEVADDGLKAAVESELRTLFGSNIDELFVNRSNGTLSVTFRFGEVDFPEGAKVEEGVQVDSDHHHDGDEIVSFKHVANLASNRDFFEKLFAGYSLFGAITSAKLLSNKKCGFVLDINAMRGEAVAEPNLAVEAKDGDAGAAINGIRKGVGFGLSDSVIDLKDIVW